MARTLVRHAIQYCSTNMDGGFSSRTYCGLHSDSPCNWLDSPLAKDATCKSCIKIRTNLKKPTVKWDSQ